MQLLKSIVTGLLSRIMVRKMGRRAAADSKQTVPVLVKVSDGEGASNNIDDDADITEAVEADAAREQFPFIFNLLRGHAISAQPQPSLGQVSGADSRRSKTSPHHHHHQQEQQQLLLQQQQARKPAVAPCRQHQTTPSARGTLHVYYKHALSWSLPG